MADLPRVKVLNVNAMQRPADYERSYYHLSVPNDVRVGDLLRPGYWAHHAGKLKAGDLIDVLSADLALDLQLRVIEAETGLVTMRLRFVSAAREDDELPDDDEAEPLLEAPLGYKVGFTEADHYYVISRMVKPPMTISTGHETHNDAVRAAIEHAAKAAGETTQKVA